MIQYSEREGHQLTMLTVGDLRIEVSRTGAELISLARRDEEGIWRGFLFRDGDVSKNPTGWNNHATLMGFYVHRILHETSLYRGQEIRGSTHSFLRHKIFPPPVVEENKITYHLSAEEILPQEYPNRVNFCLCYELRDNQLFVTFRFENLEPTVSHVSFGLHPGFAVSDLDEMQVILSPGRYHRLLAPENFLSGQVETIDFAGGKMPFPVKELPGSFLLDLQDVPDRTFVVIDTSSRRKTTLDFSEAPYLTLWSNGESFICVEPCWGLPDHHEQRSFEQKSGIQILPAYGTLERGFAIRPEILAEGA